ncbi:MAG: hypothetical protein HY619_06805 [Thaumarchaeota archaeon]|nr:hypothetical protein [Nitrososphaerota archaeon]
MGRTGCLGFRIVLLIWMIGMRGLLGWVTKKDDVPVYAGKKISAVFCKNLCFAQGIVTWCIEHYKLMSIIANNIGTNDKSFGKTYVAALAI